ncbi:MAG TPA: argininosuccinate lyase [Thermoanaerobaculia bacterium]|nr:argininosuccinate lyase [Thermoanaerobaculia bacterium]
MKRRRRAGAGKPLWAGGYSAGPGKALARLSISHPFDRRLAQLDLAGSLAHARGLSRAGLLSAAALSKIQRGLATIGREIAEGRFRFSDRDEDVHLNIERRLIDLVGDAGKRLHAGRSRNDQVALDLRLWTVAAIGRARATLGGLAGALLDRAEQFLAARVIVAARTHLRSAQPVLLAHVFHAYAEMLRRDLDRFSDARRRTAVSPLGSGACAGTTLPLDREGIARDLGLTEISANSLDAVSDRDFAAEFEAAAALAMAHLSRLAEDLILWSGEEFALFTLAEATTTGSSMMPQKRNPDSLELVRGKAGRVFADLVATLTIVKGLPLSYDRDLQETQQPLFDAADTLEASAAAMAEVVRGLRLRPAHDRPPVDPSTLATDIAEELVRQGLPFRAAHESVARWTRLASEARADVRDVAAVEAPELRPFLKKLTVESAVARRDLPGGTAPRRVRAAIARTRRQLAKN